MKLIILLYRLYVAFYTGIGQPPGSPGPLSMSGLSVNSPSSSPQMGSPGHLPTTHHQSQSTHFGFNSGTIGFMGSLTGLSSSSGSPGAIMPPPPSPSHMPPNQPPPPLPPRSHRRRESSISDSPQQVIMRSMILRLIFNIIHLYIIVITGTTSAECTYTSSERWYLPATVATEKRLAFNDIATKTSKYVESKHLSVVN